MSGGTTDGSVPGSAGPPPQRLLFLVNDLRFGGAEKHLVALVNHLHSERFECHVLRLGLGDDLLAQMGPARLAGTAALDRRSRISLGAIRAVASYVDEHSIDAVVCINEYPMLYGYLATRIAGRRPRLIEIFHTTGMLDRAAVLKMRLVYRWLFARFDVIVFVSRSQKELWTRDRGMRTRRSELIPNGIDADFFRDSAAAWGARAIRAGLGWRERDLVVGVCAALRAEKRHVDVVDAVAQVAAEGLPIRLLVIGEGPERVRITTRAAGLGISDLVHITGFQPDVRPFLGACDVMVLVSEFETFSLAILEAMAMGKPVISTDVGGAGEQVDRGVSGFLVEPGDVEQLAAHIRRLADEELRRNMGRAGRLRLEEQFTVDRMVGQYEALFSGPAAEPE